MKGRGEDKEEMGRGRGEEIELRSEEFQEVLGGVPPWILRWGITVVGAIMLLLLAGSAVFRYPDVIGATVTLTGTEPAAGIVAKASGKIRELYVEDGRAVAEGECLAVIDNPARTADVLYLGEFLGEASLNLDSLPGLPRKDVSVGNMQSAYSNYYSTLSQCLQFKGLGYYGEKVRFMRERVVRNERYHDDMARQEGLVARQRDLLYNQYRRDSIIHGEGLISDETLERTLSAYLQGELSLENVRSTLENLRIQIAQLRESLADTEYEYADRRNTLETNLRSAATQLRAEIAAWENNYALTASVAGKVTFTNYWSRNQNVTAGETVFTIVPSGSNALMGKATLPTVRSGKVAVGQRVNVRFSNFPDTEYGVVRGVVRAISRVSVKAPDGGSNYVVEIGFPEGLTTSYRKTLPFVPNMEGQADIVTDDISLLERLLLPIRKVLTEGL
jgi:HlyD family secretion protein